VDLEELVRGCLENRPGAWEALVDTYAKRIYNMALRFSGNREEAQDLTQEVFVKLWHSLPRYDFHKDFTAWLLVIARNQLIDEYRKRRQEKSLRQDLDGREVSLPSPDDPEASLARSEARVLLEAGLARLSPDMRLTLILRELEGRSYEEMAQVLGLPLGTVKSRVNRARIQLAEALRDMKGGLS
jgi:RNA polymerase sigma-70 factor (ECF subfamily)